MTTHCPLVAGKPEFQLLNPTDDNYKCDSSYLPKNPGIPISWFRFAVPMHNLFAFHISSRANFYHHWTRSWFFLQKKTFCDNIGLDTIDTPTFNPLWLLVRKDLRQGSIMLVLTVPLRQSFERGCLYGFQAFTIINGLLSSRKDDELRIQRTAETIC